MLTDKTSTGVEVSVQARTSFKEDSHGTGEQVLEHLPLHGHPGGPLEHGVDLGNAECDRLQGRSA